MWRSRRFGRPPNDLTSSEAVRELRAKVHHGQVSAAVASIDATSVDQCLGRNIQPLISGLSAGLGHFAKRLSQVQECIRQPWLDTEPSSVRHGPGRDSGWPSSCVMICTAVEFSPSGHWQAMDPILPPPPHLLPLSLPPFLLPDFCPPSPPLPHVGQVSSHFISLHRDKLGYSAARRPKSFLRAEPWS